MSNVVTFGTRLAPASSAAISKIERLSDQLLQMPQVPFITEHMLHAGMYTRTVLLPPDTCMTAVLIKIPTVFIIAGEADIYSNEDLVRVAGYNVFPGSAGRKIAMVTRTTVGMSMMFATDVKTVEDAQKAFTDEHHRLVPLSQRGQHRIVVTGE